MPKSPAQRYVNTGGRVLRTDVPEWMRTGRTIGDAATPDGNDIGTRSTLRWLCQQGAKDTIPTRQYTTTAGRATGVYPAGGGGWMNRYDAQGVQMTPLAYEQYSTVLVALSLFRN